MLKQVKYTIFHKNLTFLDEFIYKNIKFEINIMIFIHIPYKNYEFPLIDIILSLPMMVNSKKKVKFS